MNGLARVVAALTGAPADRPAFVPVLSLAGARLTGAPLADHYRDPRRYAAGQAAIRDALDPDALFAPFALPLLGAAVGGELRWYGDQAPNLRRPAIASVAEWDRIRWPAPDGHPALAFLVDATREVSAVARGEVAVVAALPAPMDLPSLAMGLEAWLDAVLFEPAAADAAVEASLEAWAALADAVTAAGASAIVLPCGLASPRIVPRAIAERFVPVLERAVAAVKAPVVLHHIGAPVLAHLDLLARVRGAAAFVVDERDDVRAAREVLGAGRALLTGPDVLGLEHRTPDEVRRGVARLLADRAGDRFFAVATTGADVTWRTPLENVGAIAEALREAR